MIPITTLSHGSMLLSQSKPTDVVQFAVTNNLKAIGLTDRDNLHQCVPYWEECEKAGLKPLLGMEVSELELVLYPKNAVGWKNLLRIHYEINKEKKNFDVIKWIDRNMVVVAKEGADLTPLDNTRATIFCGVNPFDSRPKSDLFPQIVYTPNHFISDDDAAINRVLLCKLLKIKLEQASTEEHPAFDSKNYRIMLEADLKDLVEPELIENTYKLLDLIEPFEILKAPELPHFDCPAGKTESDLLKEICEGALKEMELESPEYKDRLHKELSAISEANMSGYFLIMGDIVRWAKSKGIRVGCARGSAAGCLISYLVGITSVDPIEYGLLFERFYSADRGEYPDIDLDLQPSRRSEIEAYIKKKYGAERFMQFATFSTMKGRAALKLALTTSKKSITVDEQNEITKLLPEEAVIADELKEQNSIWGNKSTILWTLLNKICMDKWCTYNSETGDWDGTYSDEFRIGVNMNTVIQARGRHASAFVLSPEPMYERVPVAWDPKSKTEIIAVDMESGQKMGLVKLDLLGLKLLDEYNFSLGVLDGACTI